GALIRVCAGRCARRGGGTRRPPQPIRNLQVNINMSKVRRVSLAAAGGILLCSAVAVLNWPGAAAAPPASGFASDVTGSFFERIRVLGGLDREGEDAKVQIIAREASDVYIVNNTVAPG